MVPRDRQADPRGLLPEQRQVRPPVIVDKEDILPVIAALGDVVGHARNDRPRDTRHKPTLTPEDTPDKRNR